MTQSLCIIALDITIQQIKAELELLSSPLPDDLINTRINALKMALYEFEYSLEKYKAAAAAAAPAYDVSQSNWRALGSGTVA